jgi:hypothetical protein
MKADEVIDSFRSGKLPLAKKTEHFTYTEVFLGEYPQCMMGVITGKDPIPFAGMSKFYDQSDHLLAYLHRQKFRIDNDAPEMWLYHNDPTQPPDPGENPVREPFLFQVGHVVNAETPASAATSSEDCKFETKPLRALSVASIVYQGSFPHQENSGFVEAWIALVRSAPEIGYELTSRLYRELYHHLDWTDPSQSITEIQVEIRSRRARAMSA